ncbi:TonB-dependent receptor [Piscinibacter sakaiensis]|uniref:TonB-dependent receptor n=2 Tax=Piscinibacter sakaiensis TaxID=1547922 RepID=A0A0K8P6B9_PISS1|nr:TonB-dependent receptor [Piscinibacter sakaiensis]
MHLDGAFPSEPVPAGAPAGARRRPGARAAAAALAALAAAAQAQDTRPAPPATPGTLERVTVTAERRSEDIKDVPSAVSTLSGEKLDVINSGGQDVRMLSGRVPSLNIESSFGRAFPRFYIRGYGNTDFRSNASQPVSLVYDDVVQENPILKGFPVFDLARIEVLAGPQGTLFGRNTPAGVVKFDSVKPSKQLDAYGSLAVGSLQTINVEGAGNVQLGEALSARIAGQVQHRKDWVTNARPDGVAVPTDRLEGYDDRALRLQAAWTPSRDLQALFNLHHRNLDGSARLFRANIIRKGSNDLVPGFDEKRISTDGRNHQELENTGGSARLRWSLGSVTLYSITGFETVDAYSRGDIDGGYGAAFLPTGGGPGLIPFPSETAGGIRDHRQISQEFRAESNGSGPLGWQGGVYLFDETYTIDSFDYDTLGGGGQSAYSYATQKNKAWAVFGSLNYAVSPRLKLRGGLRYTNDRKDFATTVVQGTVVTSNGLTARTKDAKLSWDASGSWALDRELNAYARVATGFRGSSIQSASAFGAQTQAGPETTTSYELGLKGDLLDKRARVSLSVFSYDVKNLQLTAVGGAANVTQLINAKKATGRGVELNLDAYLGERLLVTLGASVNDTAIKDPTLAVAGCAQCTVTDPAVTIGGATYYRIDGNPLPQAPKYTLNLTARYGVPAGPGAEWFVYTDWVWRSKVNFFLYESIEFTGKPLTEGGLRLGYSWANGKYEAALYGRNITNQIRAVGGIDFNNLTGFINEPRMIGAQFKAVF